MLKIKKDGPTYRVELFHGHRLNILFSDLVGDQLRELVQEPGNTVIFNLEGIRFIDTSGFRVLLSIKENARQNGSTFKLCNVTGEVQELMGLLEVEEELVF